MLNSLKTVIHKLAVLAVAFSVVIAPFASLVPSAVEAAGFSYTISIADADFSGNTLTISAPVDVVKYVGTETSQWVKIDWGDGTVETLQAMAQTNYALSPDGKDFSIHNLVRAHTYLTEGSFTVIAKVYHGNESGNEGSGDQSNTVTFQTENTLARCTDGIDNDHDGDTDAADADCAGFQPGTLHIVKVVVGGDATASDFSFQIDGGAVTPFEADGTNDVVVSAGTLSTHTVTEVAAANYTPSLSNCSEISVPGSGEATCTITNTYVAPPPPEKGHIIVAKTAIGDDGLFTFTPSYGDSFTLSNGESVSSGDLDPNATYSVSEASLTGWTQTSATCSDGSPVSAIELGAGETVTCTFTNTREMGTLIVKKVVINLDGGTGVASDFSFAIDTGEAISFDADGQNEFALPTGTYSVTEPTVSGYTTSYDGCTGIVIGADETKTCTITNDDIAVPPPPPAVENTQALCSDGIDNDADELIDLNDPDCSAFIPVNPPNNDGGGNGGGGNGGGGGGGGGGVIDGPLSIGYVNTNGGGQVLGASTDLPAGCGAYLTEYLRFGKNNNPESVKKLQIFLNKELSLNLPITGYFGSMTLQAVNDFQIKHNEQVLKPWVIFGLTSDRTATGYVYKTTRHQINLLMCATLNEPAPQLP